MHWLNPWLLEYALGVLLRKKMHTLVTFGLFSALVFLLSSVLFISDGIKQSLLGALESLPELTLQRIRGGKQVDIPHQRAEAIAMIAGVKSVHPRVWGYYYYPVAGVNFVVMGVDVLADQATEDLQAVVDGFDASLWRKGESMLVGKGVEEVLKENYYTDFFHFITDTGEFKKLSLAGTFETSTRLLSNDTILVGQKSAYAILGLSKNDATDIVVRVSNPAEIPMVSQKIIALFPDTRVISRDDLRISYENIFNYKSGFFLALFSISTFTFFMLLIERSSGLSSQERKEIGILKALGWGMDEIITAKVYEGLIVCIFAFVVGVGGAMAYVYGWQAPLLREVFTGYSVLKPPFAMPFHVDMGVLVLLFLLCVPLYVGAMIVPAWKCATYDADEVLR